MGNEKYFVVQPSYYDDMYGDYGSRKDAYPEGQQGVLNPAQPSVIVGRDWIDYAQMGLLAVIAVGIMVNIVRK